MGYQQRESLCKRIGKCFLSAFIAGLFGVIVAEVVANSLVEISITPVFSIVFGISFVFLGVALVFRAVKSFNESSKRIFVMFFAMLVLASGGFSFLLQKEWVSIDPRAKSPMYAVVGLSLAFALSFSFTEFISMGLCDRCCKTDFENNPIISAKKQVVLIFVATTILGTVQGILFGVIDVENDNQRQSKFTENLLVSLPLGGTIGLVTGFFNQWFRYSTEDPTQWSTKVPIINANDEI